MRRNTALLALCLAGSSCGLTGCSSLSSKKGTKNSEVKIWSPSTWFEEEYQTPESLAVIWSPDVLTVAGQPPMRGFGGRVFFYNEKMQAVSVEGDLAIHGFDGDRTKVDPQSTVATKKFDFSADKLVDHFSPSDLGASYSIWVPWDPAGGPRKEISLVATFKSKDGKVVQGTPAKLSLMGRAPEGDEQASNSLKTPMQTVSYRYSETPSNVPQQPSTLRTTTISLPTSSLIGRRRKFTLGADADNQAQSVTLGGTLSSENNSDATSITVGGGQRPRSTKAATEEATRPAFPQALEVQGLGTPPTRISPNGPIAGSNQNMIVPASFTK